jgi:DNA topoisomerase VI subunit A
MTWNLRAVKMLDDNQEEKYIEIREVYYDEHGVEMGHCEAALCGESIEDLETYLGWALEGLKKPVLEFKDDDVSE